MNEDILYRLRTYYPEHPVCIAAAEAIALLREDAEKYHTQLIECKHKWHTMKQERDRLAAQLAVSEAMYQSGCQFEDQCKSLAAQNAELIETMKWIHNHGGLGYSIHGALEKAIAKAYSPDPFADKVGAV